MIVLKDITSKQDKSSRSTVPFLLLGFFLSFIDFIIVCIATYYVLTLAGKSILSDFVGSSSPAIHAFIDKEAFNKSTLKNTKPRMLSRGFKYGFMGNEGMLRSGEFGSIVKSSFSSPTTYLNERETLFSSLPQMIGSDPEQERVVIENPVSEIFVIVKSKQSISCCLSIFLTNKWTLGFFDARSLSVNPRFHPSSIKFNFFPYSKHFSI